MSEDDGAKRSHRRVPRTRVDAARCASMKMTKAKGLHDSNVKDLDRGLHAAAGHPPGLPAPRAIEIAIRKGHDYRVVVSDLDHRRLIWGDGKSAPRPTQHSSAPHWAGKRRYASCLPR